MLRAAIFAGLLGGCAFNPPAVPSDALIDSPVIDAVDAPIDADPNRSRNGLVGFWTFEELAAPILDTSGFPASGPLPINLTPTGPGVTLNGGSVTTAMISKLESAAGSRLNADLVIGGGVTLEVWVLPEIADQGTMGSPVLIAGLSSSINARNISILQAGTQWVGRVRTQGVLPLSEQNNGKPDISSTNPVVGVMTHIVLVADLDERKLYVNGDVVTDPLPGALASWDFGYRMLVGNEFSQARPWNGTFQLVALYNRALSKAEVDKHFLLGPTAP